MPLSPVMSTLLLVAATLRISSLTPLIPSERPTKESPPRLACNCLRNARFSRAQSSITDPTIELDQEFVEDHRLEQIVMRPLPKRGDGVFEGAVSGDHDHKRFGPNFEQAIKQFQAVEAGKLDIAERDLRLERFDDRQGALGILGDGDPIAFAFEKFAQGRGDHLLVVDHEHSTAIAGGSLLGLHAERASVASGTWRVVSTLSAGKRTKNVAPRPNSDSNVSRPPNSSTISRLI